MQQLPDIVQPVITRVLAASYDADTRPRPGDAIRPQLCVDPARPGRPRPSPSW